MFFCSCKCLLQLCRLPGMIPVGDRTTETTYMYVVLLLLLLLLLIILILFLCSGLRIILLF